MHTELEAGVEQARSAAHPQTGDRVYLETGQAVSFIAKLEDGVVVRAIYDGDDEPYLGKPFTTTRVFQTEPVAEWSERVLALDVEAQRIREQIKALQAEKKEEERLKALRAKNPDAKRLDDFLAGRITHVVLSDYSGPRVMTLDAALKPIEDDYNTRGKLRLLHLYGDRDKMIHWALDRYTYGPGSSEQTIYPFCSEDEAKEKAREIIAAHLDKWRESPNKHQFSFNYWLPRIAALGDELPADVVEWQHAEDLKRAQDQLSKAEAEAAAARERIAALSGAQQRELSPTDAEGSV